MLNCCAWKCLTRFLRKLCVRMIIWYNQQLTTSCAFPVPLHNVDLCCHRAGLVEYLRTRLTHLWYICKVAWYIHIYSHRKIDTPNRDRKTFSLFLQEIVLPSVNNRLVATSASSVFQYTKMLYLMSIEQTTVASKT